MIETKTVGFIGKDCYDLVYLAARTAYLLGKHAAVVDYSGEGIAALITKLPDLKESPVIDNRGVDYYAGKKPTSSYDYVFYYFGGHFSKLVKCEEMYFVTDCQLYEIERFKKVTPACADFRSLILRGGNGTWKKERFIVTALASLGISEEIRRMGFSQTDEDIRLRILYDSVPVLKGVSDGVRRFLIDFFSVDVAQKEVQVALKRLIKGK